MTVYSIGIYTAEFINIFIKMISNLNSDGTFRYTRDNRLYRRGENTHRQFSPQKYALNIISTLAKCTPEYLAMIITITTTTTTTHRLRPIRCTEPYDRSYDGCFVVVHIFCEHNSVRKSLAQFKHTVYAYTFLTRAGVRGRAYIIIYNNDI